MKRLLNPLTNLLWFCCLIFLTSCSPLFTQEVNKSSSQTVLDTVTESELKDHIGVLAGDDMEGREAGTKGGKQAGEYVAGEFKKAQLKPVGDKETFFQNFTVHGKELRNVVGYLEGEDPQLKEEVLIIGAHYDHLGRGNFGSRDPKGQGQIHHGADDNASGVAGLLEMAKAFSRLSQEKRPKRSILFISFDGEEMGTLGSNYYIQKPLFPLTNTVFMLNLDEIGRSEGGKVMVFGLASSPSFKKSLEQCNKEIGLTCEDWKSVGQSDNMVFYQQKIPYLFFWTGYSKEMHTPADVSDKINAPVLAQITELAFLFARQLAEQKERPKFTPLSGTTDQKPAGPFLGIAPSQEESKTGLIVESVVPDSGAHKAGIQKGDIITELDGEKVSNFEDLRKAVSTRKTGDTIKIKILREGKEQILDVTLGKR